MTTGSSPRIYWANAMFPEADREFNAKCADVLRGAGCNVFLPQEAAVNKALEEFSPSAKDIFRVDTCAILESELLVACIDQETIDCGVACEIGLAFAYGIPVIGLYTDIRQYRKGRGQMYKNLYVVGAIEAIGEIVPSVKELLQVIPKYLPRLEPYGQISEETVAQHFSSVAPRYSEFVTRLESWYDPPWNVGYVLDRWLQVVSPNRVIEFGCGSGDSTAYISRQCVGLFYVGYDNCEEMIQLARSRHRDSSRIFTTSWSEVERQARQEAFDIALVLFALHDHPAPQNQKTISLLIQCLRPGGILLIVDLSTLDLPRLTDLLRKRLARPLFTPDNRIEPAKLSTFAKLSDSTIVDCNIAMPLMRFPSADDLSEYLEFFGIYKGMDLPLGLTSDKASIYRQLMAEMLGSQSYPFTDQRAFIICVLKKRQ